MTGASIETCTHVELRVVVIDDEPEVLKSMTRYLVSEKYRVRGYKNAVDFLEALDWLPDISCIVSDVKLPKIDGLTLIRELARLGIRTPVILITGYGDVPLAVQAMQEGAFGFIQKPFSPDILKSQITAASAVPYKNTLLDAEIQKAIKQLDKLSGRQLEILELLSQGKTSKEIGIELQTSYRTIETHRASMVERLEVNSLADLIKLKFMADLNKFNAK